MVLAIHIENPEGEAPDTLGARLILVTREMRACGRWLSE